jgi:coenzyme F420-0:L-glutamate ligase/coenzyme F420-1:gamma-L-glutamate ligase
MTLTLTPLCEIPLIRPGDDLGGIVLHALERSDIRLQNGDILVFAQKVISKAEGRIVDLRTVIPSPRAHELATVTEKDPRMVELVLRESREVLRARTGTLIVEHRAGFVCANAGIDHSNVGAGEQPEDWVLLLPVDSDASAYHLRTKLEKASGVHLGILIIDSHGRAWRQGTVGISIGFSGLPGLVDLRLHPAHNPGWCGGRTGSCSLAGDGAGRRGYARCSRARLSLSAARWVAEGTTAPERT